MKINIHRHDTTESLKGLKSCLHLSLPGNPVTVTCNVSVYPGNKAWLSVSKKQKLTSKCHGKLKYIKLETLLSGDNNTSREFKRHPRELLKINPVRASSRSCITSCPSRQLLTELRGAATIPILSKSHEQSVLGKCQFILSWQIKLQVQCIYGSC